jgi:protein-S-isoprenylcysteine O-methyltransferase Ste14
MRPADAKRFAPAYFALQGAAVAGWWVALVLRPAWRAPFLPNGFPEDALIAFAPADVLLLVIGSWTLALSIAQGWRWTIPLAWLVAGAVDYATLVTLAQSALAGGGWLGFVAMAPAALISTSLALRLSEHAVPLLRPARTATTARNVAKTAVQIVLFWTFFLAVVPALLVRVEEQLGLARFDFPGRVPGAIVAFALLSALGLWSAATMSLAGEGTPLPLDAPRRLVVRGPYARVRNPMALAGLGQGVAVGVGLGSWTVVAYALLGSAIWNWIVRPAEEADLAARFGEPYERYRASVRCWRPRGDAYRA